MALDITARKQAEEVRRASEHLYRSLVEMLDEGIVVQSRDGAIVASNRRAREILGLAVDELTGMTSFDPRWEARRADGSPMPGEEHPAIVTLRTGRPCRDVYMDLAHPDGRRISISVDSAPLMDADGEITAVTVVFRARAAEEALRREADRHRSLADESPEGIVRVGDDGTVYEVNPAFCAILGVESADIVGTSIRGRFAPEDARPPQVPGPEPGRARAGHRTLVRADGSRAHVGWTATRLPDGSVLAAVHDLSRETELEDRLRRTERLETLGRLTGGVAHDFNNILTAISGSAEFLAESVPADDPRRADVDAIRDAGDRAAQLTRQLLDLGRAAPADDAPTDLDLAVDQVGRMLRRTIRATSDLRFDLDCGPCAVTVGRAPLDQVVVNLAVNADDAMPDGGTITIATRRLVATPGIVEAHPAAVLGPFACLSVTDTGTGIRPEDLPSIFEAFYTTKGPGGGTGLGLATVARIVNDTGGWIDVASEVGRGTTFSVVLPIAADPDTAADPASGSVPVGSEMILLVEDDPSTLRVIARQLRSLGYAVVDRADPAEALARVLDGSVVPDLLVTDIVMPEMSGVALADAVLARLPRLPVLLVSGTASDPTAAARVERGAHFLRKPFDRRELARAVRACIDGTSAD